MWAAIRSSWPLFFGMSLLMVGNGLLVTLLTVKAAELGFGEAVIGLVQSAYPVGTLLGCLATPRLVEKVGHIRVFAALASIASAAALIHLITADPWSWGAMRMLAGVCFAGLYVVAESWLNGRATNDSRASLLSIYFVIQTGGMALGQTLLNFSRPDGILLFVVVSVLISVSLVPILITAGVAPPYATPEWISIAGLFRLSPMALAGCFLSGIAQGVIYIALALYGQAIGLAAGSVGALVGFATLGGMLFQFPMGRLSDRIDRRFVITGAAGLGVPLCLGLAVWRVPAGDPAEGIAMLYAGVALLGGLTLPIYSICIAHMNDRLKPGQIVAASGTLVLVVCAGIVFGPILGALALKHFGAAGFFHLLAVVLALIAATALLRLWRGEAPREPSATAIAISHQATPGALLGSDASPTDGATDEN